MREGAASNTHHRSTGGSQTSTGKPLGLLRPHSQISPGVHSTSQEPNMKAFFLVLASVLFTAAMAMHMPWHKEHPKHPSKHSGGKRALASDENAKFELGEDDIGDDLGGLGGVGGLGGIGGIGGLGGVGGLGGLGGLGGVGVRALRGNELAEDANTLGDDEVVVAGGRAVRGGVVVTGPRRGPFY